MSDGAEAGAGDLHLPRKSGSSCGGFLRVGEEEWNYLEETDGERRLTLKGRPYATDSRIFQVPGVTCKL